MSYLIIWDWWLRERKSRLIWLWFSDHFTVAVAVTFAVTFCFLPGSRRYWPRLFWGALPLYVLEIFVINVLLMLFVVANLDSAVWGTRCACGVCCVWVCVRLCESRGGEGEGPSSLVYNWFCRPWYLFCLTFKRIEHWMRDVLVLSVSLGLVSANGNQKTPENSACF